MPKSTKQTTTKKGGHIHDWKLMRKSDISTRFKNAPPTRETIIALMLDPGDSFERWVCPDCGEDRLTYNISRGGN